jgi:hypothetical protein
MVFDFGDRRRAPRPSAQKRTPLGTHAITVLSSGKVAPRSSASSPRRDGPR